MLKAEHGAIAIVITLFLLGIGITVLPVASPGYTSPDTLQEAHTAPVGESITVNVSMDGSPADAQIVVRDSAGDVETVEYTDPLDPGQVDIRLLPGEYEFEIDAGGGFISNKVYRNVTVGSTDQISVDITRRYDPNDRGYYAADLHAHSIYSSDTTDSPMHEFVAAQLAADLDVLFISDHNSVEGHSHLKRYAQDRGVPYILSNELSTEQDADRGLDEAPVYSGGSYGHLNVYPIEEGQPVDWTGDPDDFFASARGAGAKIIQANHPLRGDNNYFHHVDSEEYNDSYETVEVYSGFALNRSGTLNQLFEFWNQGYRYTAVGVSDDHQSGTLRYGNEYGNARTYAYLDDEPSGAGEDFATAVDNQHAFATYGPLVYFETAGGAIPGENVTTNNGRVTLTAEIQNIGELSSATLIKNGTPVQEFTLSGEQATIEYEASVQNTSWFVLRVQDKQGAQGTRAITNPIWVSEDEFDE